MSYFRRILGIFVLGFCLISTNNAFAAAGPAITGATWRFDCDGVTSNFGTQPTCSTLILYLKVNSTTSYIMGPNSDYQFTTGSYTIDGTTYNRKAEVSWSNFTTAQSLSFTPYMSGSPTDTAGSTYTISNIRLKFITLNHNSNSVSIPTNASSGDTTNGYKYVIKGAVASTSQNGYIVARYGDTVPFPTLTTGYGFSNIAGDTTAIDSITISTSTASTYYIIAVAQIPDLNGTTWRFVCATPTTVGSSAPSATSITCSKIHVYADVTLYGTPGVGSVTLTATVPAAGTTTNIPMTAGEWVVGGTTYNWHGEIDMWSDLDNAQYECSYSILAKNTTSDAGSRGLNTNVALSLITLNKNSHVTTIMPPSNYGVDVQMRGASGFETQSGDTYGYKYQLIPSTAAKYVGSNSEPTTVIIARSGSDTIALPTLSASLGNGTVGWSTSASTTTHVSSMSAGTANYYLTSSCNAGYYGAATASSCTECADGTFSATAGITTASSCTACPTVSSPWVAHSTSGSRNSYAGCYRTANAATADSDCAGGVIRNAAASASTWKASSFTVPTAITAKAGAYRTRSTFTSETQVNTSICATCAAGTSSAGGNVSSCDACTNGYFAAAGASSCTACPSTHPNSHYKATAKTECFRACRAGTYYNNGTCALTPNTAWSDATITYFGSTPTMPTLCGTTTSGANLSTGATRTGGSVYDADDESDCGISMNINGASLRLNNTTKPSTPAFVVQIDGVKYYAPMTTSNVAMNGTTTKKFKQVYNNTTYSVTDNKQSVSSAYNMLIDVQTDATSFSMDQDAMSFTVTYANGSTLYGTGVCSGSGVTQYGDVVSLANTDKITSALRPGGYCYCRLLQPGFSQWVRHGNISEMTSEDGTVGCDYYACGYACAQAFQSYADFRARVFSTVPKCDANSTCAQVY